MLTAFLILLVHLSFKWPVSAFNLCIRAVNFGWKRANACARMRCMESLRSSPEEILFSFQEGQWELYKSHHVGRWTGVQTGYDPLDQAVADHMYTQVDLKLDSASDSVTHSASVVAGEVRTDCEVCFDSDQLCTKQMGVYTKEKLRSRLCFNAELRGKFNAPHRGKRASACHWHILQHFCDEIFTRL